MSQPAIVIENLAKRYKIGRPAPPARTWTAALAAAFQSHLRRLRLLSETGSEDEFIWALRDVSFSVQPGEVVGIIGRNGSGKSTLLKILSRVVCPTSGRATIRGRVGSLLEVGTGFHPELTGRENIYLNGAILGMTRAEIRRKFDEIVAFSEVERFLDTPVKRYSSGMYVRLAFAVAAHLDPEILIVDEVLAVGDAGFQQKCLGKMGTVAKQGRTVLFVSHNTLAIEALCQRAVMLNAGRIVDIGPAAQVVAGYMSSLLAQSRGALDAGRTRHIRAVRMMTPDGRASDAFPIGADIVFELDLFHEPALEHPRVGIGIHNAAGQRLVTIHTDIQQNSRWAVEGRRTIRAVWHNARLAPYRYRVDVALWGRTSDVETLTDCRTLTILPRDVYGTGALPDPNSQGYVVPDARWDLNPEPLPNAEPHPTMEPATAG
ncbi:MAG TPA: ABC transporter ATP-binding protein [Phycisphaerae bacterium]|nr:ABC transporter ATP-binding protein [Phycisphaerae bacterium]